MRGKHLYSPVIATSAYLLLAVLPCFFAYSIVDAVSFIKANSLRIGLLHSLATACIFLVIAAITFSIIKTEITRSNGLKILREGVGDDFFVPESTHINAGAQKLAEYHKKGAALMSEYANNRNNRCERGVGIMRLSIAGTVILIAVSVSAGMLVVLTQVYDIAQKVYISLATMIGVALLVAVAMCLTSYSQDRNLVREEHEAISSRLRASGLSIAFHCDGISKGSTVFIDPIDAVKLLGPEKMAAATQTESIGQNDEGAPSTSHSPPDIGPLIEQQTTSPAHDQEKHKSVCLSMHA